MYYPTHCEGTGHFESIKKNKRKPNTGLTQRNTYWRDGAHSNSENSVGIEETRPRENPRQPNPISRKERSGRVRAFANTERVNTGNTNNMKDRHRHGLCNIARKRAERKKDR